MQRLFSQELFALNVGLENFSQHVNTSGGKSIQIDWRPPAEGDAETGLRCAQLINDPRIEEANQIAFARYLEADPVLESIEICRDVVSNIGSRMLLHAGPPVEWEQMCGPMKGAIIGAVIYEGWASDQDAAQKLISKGEIEFDSCHHHGVVGPMAGIVSPSMPVWVVRNSVRGNKAFSTLNEGLGKVLRFGANSSDVIQRLKWIEKKVAPTLRAALRVCEGGIQVKPIMAQALHMGDEVHNRNVAATSLLIRKILPFALRSQDDPEQTAEVFEFIAGNDHFFLNISMAACKCMLDAAQGVRNSCLVTAMARNGVEFGIRISGFKDMWFTSPAPVVDGLFFSGFSNVDAAADMGDSAITETAGLGGFAMAASPAIVQFVGGSTKEATKFSLQMGSITVGRNNAFTLPTLDFLPTAAGIDVLKVVDSGILPVINTGIAHKEPGIGQIGAGISRAPMECFTKVVQILHGQSSGS